MLKQAHTKKNKICLADYNYRRDLENRLLMSRFGLFDVEVLEEILHSSLTLQLSNLTTTLEADIMEVMEAVDKLSQTGLLKREGEMITVDKEMRKYYEFQVRKFDDDFRPDMEFLQALLRTVPIHVLPNWYAIPRTSTNIFQSLIERYLETPRTYQRYLIELNFDDAVLQNILDDVLAAPDFKIHADVLRERYDLDKEQFAEAMLLLEFNFLCFLSYNQVGDQWKEVVTPFQEWRDYLRFLRDTRPEPLTDPVEEMKPGEFIFAADLNRQLKSPFLEGPYGEWVEAKIGLLGLREADQTEWLALEPQDAAIALYRHSENHIISAEIPPDLECERNLREIERGLSRIDHLEWVSFDAFLKGMVAGFGPESGPKLEKHGRRWHYSLPDYTEEEKAFIHAAIFERFFEAGFVSISNDRTAFHLTAFGRMLLS